MVTTPDYVNNVQGTITQTDNTLGLAIAGQGFFAVSEQNGEANNIPTFNPQQFYSRAGDFQMDKNGFLVNSAGDYLNGWPVDPNDRRGQSEYADADPGNTDRLQSRADRAMSRCPPICRQRRQPTRHKRLADPRVDVYDSLGTMHTVTLNWIRARRTTGRYRSIAR